jgi:hypothetical protein
MINEILVREKFKDMDYLADLILYKEIKDETIWYVVPETVSSPDINLIIEELKELVARASNPDDEEKKINRHYGNFIKKIELYKNKPQ